MKKTNIEYNLKRTGLRLFGVIAIIAAIPFAVLIPFVVATRSAVLISLCVSCFASLLLAATVMLIVAKRMPEKTETLIIDALTSGIAYGPLFFRKRPAIANAKLRYNFIVYSTLFLGLTGLLVSLLVYFRNDSSFAVFLFAGILATDVIGALALMPYIRRKEIKFYSDILTFDYDVSIGEPQNCFYDWISRKHFAVISGGLRLESENPHEESIVVTSSELNLSAIARYKATGEMMKIFVQSDMDSSVGERCGLAMDITFVLTPELLYLFRKNGCDVAELEDTINNRYKLMMENCKKAKRF